MRREYQFAALLLVPLALLALFFSLRAPSADHCIGEASRLQLCALSGMAKPAVDDHPVFEHPYFDLSRGAVQLHAARNEVVASQWLLRGADRAGLSLELSAFQSQSGPLAVQPVVSQYLAHFHRVDRGGYSWGPESEVKRWPAAYPDALVPKQHACSGKQLYAGLPASELEQESSLLWFDIYVPDTLAAGHYWAQLTVRDGGATRFSTRIELQVWDAILPHDNTIDAIGEVYRSYRLEGVGEGADTDAWSAMSQCYQQLAHAHRATFLERDTKAPASEVQRQRYLKSYGSALDGSLFSAEHGYSGPGLNTPVSVWRTPWPQPFDMELQGPLSYSELRGYETLAREWRDFAAENDWLGTRWFAYVFDEVDGPEHSDKAYLSMVHQQMARVQEAIDAGSGSDAIALLWTSHSNPADWAADLALDLRGKVRLWAPNAHAADPVFLAEQRSRGDRNWFYHSGHPAVGVHSINASGIELRTWGVIAARYGIDGVLMWAVNLGNDDKPFADPSYKPDDDRFGNGVLVYPGNQLPKIGFPASPGAIPSARLKAWRRGLQDFELIELARHKIPAETEALLRGIMPRALAEGEGRAAWSSDPAAWIEFKRALLALASE